MCRLSCQEAQFWSRPERPDSADLTFPNWCRPKFRRSPRAHCSPHPLQLRRKSLRTADASTRDITGAQGNDLGLRYTGKAEHNLGKKAGDQKNLTPQNHLEP